MIKVTYECDPGKLDEYKQIAVESEAAAKSAVLPDVAGLLNTIHEIYHQLYLLALSDGRSPLPCLIDVNANDHADAELIDGKFGLCWKVFDPDGLFQGLFIGYRSLSAGNVKKCMDRGLSEELCLIPAMVVVKLTTTGKLINLDVVRKYRNQYQMKEGA